MSEIEWLNSAFYGAFDFEICRRRGDHTRETRSWREM
uniref:Uncharacterized protein n=1 Tax=Arundo donax TaxID=35708 RepID=A0A0A8YPU8_ARUDO